MGDFCSFRYYIFQVFIFVNILFFKHGRSVDYVVGDDEGWSSQTNFDAWSRKYNFTTGDVLVFKYVKGEHNVYEVVESTFRSCDTSSGVIAKYESGNDEIEVREAKKYWFICNIDGHCLGGMRFVLDVKPNNNTNNSTSSGPPISSTSSHSYNSTFYSFFLIIFVAFFGIHV